MDLKVGDKVVHRGCWGKDKPEIAKVTKIQRNEDEGTDKYIDTISWESFHARQREYVVDFSDGHWAYSYQINPLWKRIELNE
tara:strand:- start:2082 stop:2327 length:246 start_codon:yes stop_codon:yes gene_type:complete